jgi:hypothetical protein
MYKPCFSLLRKTEDPRFIPETLKMICCFVQITPKKKQVPKIWSDNEKRGQRCGDGTTGAGGR